ncbi:MAG: hypothetical protein HC842_02245 [Cytophagales bacterium]|nr:hypothetical protein [Cytophagales bacterium]
MNDMDAPELIAILGEQRAQEIMQLTPEERFAATSGAYAFRAFGISKKLNKISDFRKLTAMMQTVFGNPILAQSFMQRYSADRYLDEILSSLDVDVSRIKLTKDEEQLRAEQTALAQQQAEAEQGVEPGQDGDQSKIPQAGGDNMGEEGMSDRPQAIGFPPSPAVKGMTVR